MSKEDRKVVKISITEKQFESQVKELAKLFGWKYYHPWLSIHSPRGWPDVVLCRPPRLVLAELKAEKGLLSESQKEWAELLQACPGVEYYCFRPSDFDKMVEILKR